MATITANEYAPAEDATYDFANLDDFTLAPGGSIETDDPELVKAALEHPWLDVEGEVTPEEVEEEQAVATQDYGAPEYSFNGGLDAAEDND